MRVAVIGAGGTGGFFGGLLARGGEEVVFIARGAHLEAIRRHGLAVKSRLAGEFTVRAQATDNPAEVGPVDLVLVCVKTYSLDEAVAMLPPLAGPGTAILSVQNGIDNEDRIARAVGPGHVLGAVAHVSSLIESPGVVAQVAGPGKLLFGELDGSRSARVGRLRDVFVRSGIAAEVRDDIRTALWEKFVMICGVSGVTALTRLPIGPILATPETARVLRGTMEEVEAVARAGGVPLPEGCVGQAMDLAGSFEPEMRGSMAHDLAAGRRLELEALNGTVVRLGQARGIPTPFNFVIYAALKPFVAGTPALGWRAP
jgi:2-dehydropantoate 2-reductase